MIRPAREIAPLGFHFPFPVLLVDIGGTHARFALAREPTREPVSLGSLKTADFADFVDALGWILDTAGAAPNSAMICAAGPVENKAVRLTNANWTIDGPALARRFGFQQGLIFNDFEALALSVPIFWPDWLRTIGSGIAAPDGARLVHGPGTGLGSAALIDVEGKWRAIPSEGSHSDFAPVYEDEIAIWPRVERRLGRLTPETLISGPGLRRLHCARLLSAGGAAPDWNEAEIIERAVANPDGQEGDTARLFWRLTARYAGDVALTFLATGGVYLAGGILPRIHSLLEPGEFRRIFENRAPYDALAAGIPVHLIMRSDVALLGMAEIARTPERYAIDYSVRAWSR